MSRQLETDIITQRLDRIVEILEDLFILQGSIARMKRQELRRLVGLDIKRVNRISKHIKLPPDESELEPDTRRRKGLG